MATWPATLPSYVLVEGYSEMPPVNSIRTQMDVGPPKVRRRSTAAPRPITCKQHMTKTQVAILDTFYVTTLSSGVDPFDWTHPRTGASVSFTFTEPPTYESLGGTAWGVTLKLEILP